MLKDYESWKAAVSKENAKLVECYSWLSEAGKRRQQAFSNLAWTAMFCDTAEDMAEAVDKMLPEARALIAEHATLAIRNLRKLAEKK